jgi:hypothetical protein
MGRPIKQKYFLRGGVTPSDSSFIEGWYGLSGTVSAAGTRYPVGTTVTIPQGQLGAESVTATANLTINPATGAISGITMTNYGSGYNSTVTNYTLNQPASKTVVATMTNTSYTLTGITSVTGIAVGMRADAPFGMQANAFVTTVGTNSVTLSQTMTISTTTSVTFSSQGANATLYFSGVTPADAGTIAATAWITGDSQARTAAIVRQEASHRYLVEAKTNGSLFLGQCKLISTSTYAAGQMTITALDTNGSSYFVTKLTARKARIVQYVKSGSFVFASGAVVGWNLTAASATAVKVVTNAV